MIIYTLQEFCKFFQKGKPLLSIDYGCRKSGIAISTPDHHLSMPLKLITNKSQKKKLQEIITIIKEKGVCAIVIGLPFNMDGTKSDQTLLVEQFAEKLMHRTNLAIFVQDERLTSKAADNLLRYFGIKRKKRDLKDDLAAASMILETTLDSAKKLFSQSNS